MLQHCNNDVTSADVFRTKLGRKQKRRRNIYYK